MPGLSRTLIGRTVRVVGFTLEGTVIDTEGDSLVVRWKSGNVNRIGRSLVEVISA